MRPRTSSVGIVSFSAARERRSPSTRVERVSSGEPNLPLTKRGSQCHTHRPSARWRRFFFRPSRFFGRGRCGLYAPIASATSSSDANPSRFPVMKSPMRLTPAASIRGATSTSTSAMASGSPSVSAIAASDAIPPSDAPTRAGGWGIERAMARTSRGERVEAVVAVGCPGAVAVAAQVDGVRAPVLAQHPQRGSPRVAGLPAAMEQHDGRRARGRPRHRPRASVRRHPQARSSP